MRARGRRSRTGAPWGPSPRATGGEGVVGTCPVSAVICMLTTEPEPSQTSWPDNEVGLGVLYQSNQSGRRQNAERYLEREISH